MLRNRPRRTSYINARIQGRIITRIAAYWALYHLVLWMGMFVYRFVRNRAELASGGEWISIHDLYHQFASDYYPMLFCACLVLPLFMIDFVRLTHRIAGPLVRFRIALVQLMQGHRIDEVELRKGDLLTEFQVTFNEFLAFYNSRLDGRAPAPQRMTGEQADLLALVTSADNEPSHTAEAAAAR